MHHYMHVSTTVCVTRHKSDKTYLGCLSVNYLPSSQGIDSSENYSSHWINYRSTDHLFPEDSTLYCFEHVVWMTGTNLSVVLSGYAFYYCTTYHLWPMALDSITVPM